MRPPPPLTLLCAPSRAWRAVCASLAAAAAAAMAAWVAGHLGTPLPWTLGASLVAAATGALLCIRVAGPLQPAHVSWDGQHWAVDEVPGDLQVMLDIDRWLLLRSQPHDGAAVRWLAISCARGAGDWPALRTALYSDPPQATRGTQASKASKVHKAHGAQKAQKADQTTPPNTAAPHVRAPDRAAD